MAFGTILLAEDNEDDEWAVKRLFRKCLVLNPLQVVRDGEETIRYLQGTGVYADRSRYPVPLMLLLDIRMPRVDGLQVLNWLRDHPQPSMVSIVLTGYDDLRRMQEAYRLGAKSFLMKPLSEEEFCSFVACFKGMELAKESQGLLG